MRRGGPHGVDMEPEASVLGNEIGRRVRSVRCAWMNACAKAGLTDVHLADLRHESASRFDDAGMAISFVSTNQLNP